MAVTGYENYLQLEAQGNYSSALAAVSAWITTLNQTISDPSVSVDGVSKDPAAVMQLLMAAREDWKRLNAKVNRAGYPTMVATVRTDPTGNFRGY